MILRIWKCFHPLEIDDFASIARWYAVFEMHSKCIKHVLASKVTVSFYECPSNHLIVACCDYVKLPSGSSHTQTTYEFRFEIPQEDLKSQRFKFENLILAF